MLNPMINATAFSDAPLVAFYRSNHRFPRLTDDPPAYTYRGWLLPYVIMAHAVIPETANRWDYYFKLCDTTTPPIDPIPQIQFLDIPHGPTAKAVNHWVEILETQGWNAFGEFIDWLAYGLAVSKTPPRLPDASQARLYREVQIHQLLQFPYDYLGELLCERRSRGHNPTQFYPTPATVVSFMTQMLYGDPTTSEKLRTLDKICDPCCGTGRMLLYASNHSLRLYGMDIDALVVKIACINGVLYAPWMAFPLPEQLFSQSVQPMNVPATTHAFAIHDHQSFTAGDQLPFPFHSPQPNRRRKAA